MTAQSDAIHAQMWKAVKERAQANPPARIADDMLKGLTASLGIQRQRTFAWESRVPDSVIWLLLLGCIAGITAIGLAGGLGNHRGLPARIIVTLLLCATICVVLDLDRPHEGLINISQSPMLQLQKILSARSRNEILSFNFQNRPHRNSPSKRPKNRKHQTMKTVSTSSPYYVTHQTCLRRFRNAPHWRMRLYNDRAEYATLSHGQDSRVVRCLLRSG